LQLFLDDATGSSAIDIENAVRLMTEDKDVSYHTDPAKEDELLRQYQSELPSRNKRFINLEQKMTR